MSTERHVIFGAGQVGSPLATLLLERGHEVVVAKRSPGGIPSGAKALRATPSIRRSVEQQRRGLRSSTTA